MPTASAAAAKERIKSRFQIDHAACPMPDNQPARTPRLRARSIGKVGDIVSESPGDFKSVHPGDFVGICSCSDRATWRDRLAARNGRLIAAGGRFDKIQSRRPFGTRSSVGFLILSRT
jgi:hypothetical protein